MMTDGKSNVMVGTSFALLSLFILFVLTPLGVDVPTTSVTEEGSVTPRFFPNFITILMLVFSVAMIVKGFLHLRELRDYEKDKKNPFLEDEPRKFDKQAAFVRGFAMITLISVYFIADVLGIVVTCALLYLLFALYIGEKRPVRPVAGAVICSGLLYYFFVYVAQVPMPMGTIFGG